MIENSEGGRDRSKGLHGRNGLGPFFRVRGGAETRTTKIWNVLWMAEEGTILVFLSSRDLIDDSQNF
jgi:hypothetical protein